MDYRGIITKGYHVDTGGQNAIRIITQGYIETLATLIQIFNIVKRTAYYQVISTKDALFGKTQTEDSRFQIIKKEDIVF